MDARDERRGNGLHITLGDLARLPFKHVAQARGLLQLSLPDLEIAMHASGQSEALEILVTGELKVNQ